eukprot:Gb_40997 [translate_table: standard]
MPRSEEIIMLEVQNPLSSPFYANDLKWTRVHGGRNKYDDVALVPFERIHDFIEGENSNLDAPTNFYISSHHTNIQGSLRKPKIDSFLQYTMYWCYYGPKDYRVKGNILHDESSRPKSGDGSRPRRKHAMRGWGTRAMFSPHLSNEIKKWVKSMLYLGVPGDIISSSSSANDIQNWMEKLQSRIHEVDPAWRPSAFIVDDATAKINTISDVFGCRVLLCLWHVHMCVKAMRRLPHSNQETNGAIEAYHGTLKDRLSREAWTGSSRRLDWLVHVLSIRVHAYYWFGQYRKSNGFVQNLHADEYKASAWFKALEIPDSNVIVDANDSHFVRVRSQSNPMLMYVVWNPGSEFALCDCYMASCGNICKHVIKVNMLQQYIGPTIANDTSNQLEIRPCSPVDVNDVPPECLDRHEDDNVYSTHANEDNVSSQSLKRRCSTILHNLLDTLPDDPSILEYEMMVLTSL